MATAPAGNAQLALDTLAGRPTDGIPSWLLNIMEHGELERLAGEPAGAYRADPERVYLACQRRIGTAMIDQWIPRNPLSMDVHGYESGTARTATTGAAEIVRDGIRIDGPEAVAEHLERHVFPELRRRLAAFDPVAHGRAVLAHETAVQATLGEDILKAPYGCFGFPALAYGSYGYDHYLCAFALYPELMEQHFRLQADLQERENAAAAAAIVAGGRPRWTRLDHDMALSRGLMVRLAALERLWLPHFARAIAPVRQAGIRMVWHCDGNLMQLFPRLIEAGIEGFQGFQYEFGMDYRRICQLRDRSGRELMIIAGVSVTTTLPHGTPEDVRRELRFLVEHGPRQGLLLGASSSIAPGVPRANLDALVEGLAHYRRHGRG